MRIAAPATTNSIGYPAGYALTVAAPRGINTVFCAPNIRLLTGNQGMRIGVNMRIAAPAHTNSIEYPGYALTACNQYKTTDRKSGNADRRTRSLHWERLQEEILCCAHLGGKHVQ